MYQESKKYFDDMFKDGWSNTYIHFGGQEFSAQGIPKWINPSYKPLRSSNQGFSTEKTKEYGMLYVPCWAENDVDVMRLSDEVVAFVKGKLTKDYFCRGHEVIDHGWNEAGSSFVVLAFTVEGCAPRMTVLDITITSPNEPVVARIAGGGYKIEDKGLIDLTNHEWHITSSDFVHSLAFAPDIDAIHILVDAGDYLEDISDFVSGWVSLKTFKWESGSERINNVTGICYNCMDLEYMPCIDTSRCTDLTDSWNGCATFEAFPDIDSRKVTNFTRTWKGCNGLLTAPNVIVSEGLDFTETFMGMGLVVKYGDLDTAKGMYFDGMFHRNGSLQCMMKLDTRNLAQPAVDMFEDCDNLEMPSVGYQVQLANDGIEWINGNVC